MSDFDLSSESIIAYLDENEIVNEKGERLSFDDRPFLYDPMSDLSQFQVYKKCAQIGMSVTMVVKTLWCGENMGWNIIHTFPTETDSNEFVETKTDEIIKHNPIYSEISGSLQRKNINGRFLYYKGTVSKTAMIMTSADLIVADEYDRSAINVVDQMDSRLQASKFAGKWWLSNPTYEDVGVDEKFKMSDQKEWYVECRNGHSHKLTWPDSINQDKKIYICKECKVELEDFARYNGDWVPENPGAEISGYHISLMMAPWVPASYIVKQWNEGKDPETFYNFVLGEGYSPADTRVTRTMILDNWTPNHEMVRKGTNNVFMGVDVKENVKNYVVGTEKGIFKVGEFQDWADLDGLLDYHKPNVCIIDAMPDRTMSDHFMKKYRNVFVCFFHEDKENNELIRYGEGDKKGIISADRNRVIDRLVNDLVYGRFLYAVRADRTFQDYIKQCEVMRRVKVIRKHGETRYVWEASDPNKANDYFFATVYWWIAKQMKQNGIVIGEVPGRQEAIIQKADGFHANIEAMLENRNYGNNGNL